MTRSRWWAATLLFLAAVINYVDRHTLSVLAPVLRDQFHMPQTDYSHVVFAPQQRAFAIGFFNSGSTLGAVFTPPLVTWIALRWGWRQAFVFTATLGFAWLAIWLATYHPPATAADDELPAARRTRWRQL